jgi:hypothetical protein
LALRVEVQKGGVGTRGDGVAIFFSFGNTDPASSRPAGMIGGRPQRNSRQVARTAASDASAMGRQGHEGTLDRCERGRGRVLSRPVLVPSSSSLSQPYHLRCGCESSPAPSPVQHTREWEQRESRSLRKRTAGNAKWEWEMLEPVVDPACLLGAIPRGQRLRRRLSTRLPV